MTLPHPKTNITKQNRRKLQIPEAITLAYKKITTELQRLKQEAVCLGCHVKYGNDYEAEHMNCEQ